MEFRTALGIVVCFVLNFTAEILRTLVFPDATANVVILVISWILNTGALIGCLAVLGSRLLMAFKTVFAAIGLWSLISLTVSIVSFII